MPSNDDATGADKYEVLKDGRYQFDPTIKPQPVGRPWHVAHVRNSIMPVCTTCHRGATEILDYRIAAAMENIPIAEFVQRENPTVNPRNKHMLCADCQMKQAMISNPIPEGWVAP